MYQGFQFIIINSINIVHELQVVYGLLSTNFKLVAKLCPIQYQLQWKHGDQNNSGNCESPWKFPCIIYISWCSSSIYAKTVLVIFFHIIITMLLAKTDMHKMLRSTTAVYCFATINPGYRKFHYAASVSLNQKLIFVTTWKFSSNLVIMKNKLIFARWG